MGHRARGLQRRRQRLGLLHATTRRARAPTAGARTASPASPTTSSCSASRSRSGTARDPILKERLFGLTNSEGNHGEDVKEYYFYLDSTPTHSYMKYLYKYPQAAFPYDDLVDDEPRAAARSELEYELLDTGVFDDDRYFDVFVEYAKAVARRHPDPDHRRQPRARAGDAAPAADALVPQHLVVGRRQPRSPSCAASPDGARRASWSRVARASSATATSTATATAPLLFTENETNTERLFGTPERDAVRQGRHQRLRRPRPARRGESRRTRAPRPPRTTRSTVAAGRAAVRPPAADADGARRRWRDPFGAEFDAIVRSAREREADEFYAALTPPRVGDDARDVMRQALAGCCGASSSTTSTSTRWLRSTASTRSPTPATAASRNARLVPHGQRRRHLDAGQVGVPLVRRLGPGVPRVAAGDRRPRLRQAAARC